MNTPEQAKAKMVAAYALRCTNEEDLATFHKYLDDYSTGIIAYAVQDLLEYLGMEGEVEVEVIQLTREQRDKLEQSGTLEDYLTNRKDKSECDG
jgi:hypothetical protein